MGNNEWKQRLKRDYLSGRRPWAATVYMIGISKRKGENSKGV